MILNQISFITQLRNPTPTTTTPFKRSPIKSTPSEKTPPRTAKPSKCFRLISFKLLPKSFPFLFRHSCSLNKVLDFWVFLFKLIHIPTLNIDRMEKRLNNSLADFESRNESSNYFLLRSLRSRYLVDNGLIKTSVCSSLNGEGIDSK